MFSQTNDPIARAVSSELLGINEVDEDRMANNIIRSQILTDGVHRKAKTNSKIIPRRISSPKIIKK
jgi:hypothetical protein